MQLHDQITKLNSGSFTQKSCSVLDFCFGANIFRGFKDKKLSGKLKKVESLFNKDLDLIKYVTKKRTVWMATFAMLEKEHRLAIKDLCEKQNLSGPSPSSPDSDG